MSAGDPGIDPGRVTLLNDGEERVGPVFYWMSRDQRARDNWALLFARRLAGSRRAPLVVCFCLAPGFLGATIRQYGFMLRGLAEVDAELASLNIPFHLVEGEPEDTLPAFLEEHGAGAVVCDFDPLLPKRRWRDAVARSIGIPLYEVDAHNVVPCRAVSQKQEYAARTFRPKVHRLLAAHLVDYPALEGQKEAWNDRSRLDWGGARERFTVELSPGEVSGFKPGPGAAMALLQEFIDTGLQRYTSGSNDPNSGVRSRLSPYLHFGGLSAQRAALEVARSDAPEDEKEGFLEQLIVRRELSDNFCFYNSGYATAGCFPAWAKATLEDHARDIRDYLYSREEFERAETHDELWNAAQREVVLTGSMHGYMRMYWAKKILEWSTSPEEAVATAVYLNDRYGLDGRDPNGYAGIAWSIGGVHDRAWSERPVFGKVRYMSYRGCRRKFDVDAYVERVGLPGGNG